MEPVTGPPTDDPVDRLIIQLRAYVERPRRRRSRKRREWSSGIAVVFDTETTVDPSLRLRFGAYQVRDHGELIERGLFFAHDMPESDRRMLQAEFAKLQPTDAGEELKLRPVAEFIDRVFFGWGYDTRGLIVGFNLPFDISRLAKSHTYAKGGMRGGFSFTLADGRPNVRVKHLSQRASFIDFAGRSGEDHNPDRGFFRCEDIRRRDDQRLAFP